MRKYTFCSNNEQPDFTDSLKSYSGSKSRGLLEAVEIARSNTSENELDAIKEGPFFVESHCLPRDSMKGGRDGALLPFANLSKPCPVCHQLFWYGLYSPVHNAIICCGCISAYRYSYA